MPSPYTTSVSKIGNILASGRTISFEFFPPVTSEGKKSLAEALTLLGIASPSFVSVTTGAGGSNPEVTKEFVIATQPRVPFPVMAHLTCVRHSRKNIQDLLASYEQSGICNILALAGDKSDEAGEMVCDIFYASELVTEIREHSPNFGIGVAAHPEVHPRSANRKSDRQYLAKKLEVADFAITQFFFDTGHYLRLRDELADLGCYKPIIPGVMPVTSLERIARFAEMNGSEIDKQLWEKLESSSPSDRDGIAGEYATKQCLQLLAEDAPGIHLYTLNKAQPCLRIAEQLVDWTV